MSRTSIVFALPPEVLQDFNAEIVSNNFSNFEHLSMWLAERGQSVSKSTIHRYATQYKELVRVRTITPEQISIMGFRVQCLEIASRLEPGNLFSKAQEMFDWARAE